MEAPSIRTNKNKKVRLLFSCNYNILLGHIKSVLGILVFAMALKPPSISEKFLQEKFKNING
jgi:hypothetical protein